VASSCARFGSLERAGVAGLIGPGRRLTCAVARDIDCESDVISEVVAPRRTIFLSRRDCNEMVASVSLKGGRFSPILGLMRNF
jgi:hypothetical protein